MNQPNILPGLFDKTVEFLRKEEEVFCFYNGSRLCYDQFEPWMIDKIKGHMLENPAIVKSVAKNPLNFNSDFIKKYIYYVFGRLNYTPDIDLDGTMNEEFHVCFNNGKPLSDGELRIVRNIASKDRDISDRSFISKHTVNSHLRNIRCKSALKSKPELVLEARNQGII